MRIILAATSLATLLAISGVAFADEGTSRHSPDHSRCKEESEARLEERFEILDADLDDRISREELLKSHEIMFESFDRNKDGFLSREELKNLITSEVDAMRGSLRHGTASRLED